MTAETPETGRKQVTAMSDREIAEETLTHLRHVDDLMTAFGPVLSQFRVSGLLAVRRAVKATGNGSTR